MLHVSFGRMTRVILFLCVYGVWTSGAAQAMSTEALYNDCKKALIFSGDDGIGQKMTPTDKAIYMMSFFKCGGYINGALEMKRALNSFRQSNQPYCSPQKSVLNLTIATRLFVSFVEGGKKTKSQNPAADELMLALVKVLPIEGDLAQKHGCFPQK